MGMSVELLRWRVDAVFCTTKRVSEQDGSAPERGTLESFAGIRRILPWEHGSFFDLQGENRNLVYYFEFHHCHSLLLQPLSRPLRGDFPERSGQRFDKLGPSSQ